MDEVENTTGIRAAAGIGTNLYLAKIALDILAKHAPDFTAELDEESFREKLWDHRPLTDFWRIGRGLARRLDRLGVHTMRQIANYDEDVLYDMFGIDAELIIDHAMGRETTEIADIKAYEPKAHSLSGGQVLMRDYSFEEGRIVLREMVEQLCLDMVSKGLVTGSVTVFVGYSTASGRPPEGGTAAVDAPTNSVSVLTRAVLALYDGMTDRGAKIRRFSVCCNNAEAETGAGQLSFFEDEEKEEKEADRKIQLTMLDIKERFGKNAIFRSADLREGATALERNMQIGGHKSGV